MPSVQEWLDHLKLSQYLSLFQPFSSLEDLLPLNEPDIYAMGVRNSSHRALIVSSLVQLRLQSAKRSWFLGTESSATQQETTAVTESKLGDSCAADPADSNLSDMVPTADEAQSLRHLLERELSQDGSRLESHGWYHGPIRRPDAESLLSRDGDFLVRDSSTGGAGDLVLSCYWNGGHLHFLIDKVVDACETVRYQLEGESFETVADLVTCYVSGGQSVSAASGARLLTPVHRRLPLSSYAARSASAAGLPTGRNGGESSGLAAFATLPRRPRAVGHLRVATTAAFSTHSLPRPASNRLAVGAAAGPPKPSRDSVALETDVGVGVVASSLFDLDRFQTTLLPADENKPLDMECLEELGLLLDKYSAKTFSQHLLHDDLDVLDGLSELDNARPRYQRHYGGLVGVASGVQLATLPMGHQLRSDLLERTRCLKHLVAVTVLACSADEERVALLNRWIEIAIETKTALGNMYGFAGLLLGLLMPQVQRLDSTWRLLRHRHTQTALTFESRLKPLLLLMERGEHVHAPNCTVPDLHSALLVWQVTGVDALLDAGVDASSKSLGLRLNHGGPDFGLDALTNHMNLIRSWSANAALYRRNQRTVLEGVAFDPTLLDMFRTEFHLKFLWGSKGAAAAAADGQQRYEKFHHVLNALSERCQPSS